MPGPEHLSLQNPAAQSRNRAGSHTERKRHFIFLAMETKIHCRFFF